MAQLAPSYVPSATALHTKLKDDSFPPAATFQADWLPHTDDDVTTPWLLSVLPPALSAAISDTKVTSVNHGSSSSVVIKLDYSPSSTSTSSSFILRNNQPNRLFLKSGLNPELIAVAPSLLATHRREAEFYHYLAPALNAAGMRLPRPYYSAISEKTGQGLVLLGDLKEHDPKCTFATPQDVWAADMVMRGVEQLAVLHRNTWACDASPSPEWLKSESAETGLRGIIRALLQPEPFQATVPRNLSTLDDGVASKSVLLERERIERAFASLWKTSDAELHRRCLIHGDPHIANTYVTGDGHPGFLDFQTASLGNPFHDVAYFVASALSPGDRRANEDAIVKHYVACLSRGGGPKIEFEDACMQYRRHLFHGYVMCLAQPGMQSQENIWAMVERFVAAIVDHKVIELLESELGS